MKTLMKGLMFAAALLMAGGAAQATTITVDGTVCTLAEAITSANNDNAAGNGCADGSAEDTLILQQDVLLTAPLPEITSAVTIEGGGHKIDGNSLGFVLWIDSSGVLTLNKAVITGGSTRGYCATNGIMPSGGGVYNEGQLVLNNSTVSGNRGDGIHTNMGSLTVSNTTISESKSSAIYMVAGCEGIGSGGGVGIYVSGGGTAILRSSVITGNFRGEIFVWEGTITADSYNVFGHSGKSNANAFYGFTPGAKDVTATSDGTKPTVLAAILSPLADNGGATQTYALPMCSPAIDLDATCSTVLSTDQRGYIRPVGSGCDAGSFEFDSVRSDTDGDGTPDACDNCPATPNSDQKDSNGDGIGNACEQVNMAPIYKLLLKR